MAVLGLCCYEGFSLVVAGRGHCSCGAGDSQCSGFSCGAQTLGRASFSSYSAWALEHGLNSCGAQARLLCWVFLDQGWNPCLLH